MVIKEYTLPNGTTVCIDDAYMSSPDESARLDKQVIGIAAESIRRRIRREREAGRDIENIIADIRDELDGRRVQTA